MRMGQCLPLPAQTHPLPLFNQRLSQPHVSGCHQLSNLVPPTTGWPDSDAEESHPTHLTAPRTTSPTRHHTTRHHTTPTAETRPSVLSRTPCRSSSAFQTLASVRA